MAERNHKALAIKARTIYNQQLKGSLETCCRGQFVAIEVDSGDYFLGPTPLEAVKNGKAKYPPKAFHIMKVGYKAAVLLKRGVSNDLTEFKKLLLGLLDQKTPSWVGFFSPIASLTSISRMDG